MPDSSVVIADTFFKSVHRIDGEAKRVLTFIGRFRSNPANPGVSLERVRGAMSSNVWSARVSKDLRSIIHKDAGVWCLMYCGHHDDAYDWATRHKVGRHEVTGQLQIVPHVSTPETAPETRRPVGPPRTAAEDRFADCTDEYLLSIGVPRDWLPSVRRVRTEDHLLELVEELPSDVGDRLLRVYDGDFVTPPKPLPASRPVTEAASLQRRFFFVSDDDDGLLTAALQEPLERWIAFLHPLQRSTAERRFSGPAKVSGAAGTGKTVVAMHRARNLARGGERVLLATYNRTLSLNLARGLRMLCSDEEFSAIDVRTVDSAAWHLVGDARVRVDEERAASLLEQFRRKFVPQLQSSFVEAEWKQVIQMQGIKSWPEYREARRVGRHARLPVGARDLLWRVFEATLACMAKESVCTWPGLSTLACELLSSGKVESPYTAVVVDEVQDLNSTRLRFLYSLCDQRPYNFMVCGDAGQRIYPGGFSLRALGIEVRGRSSVLQINYRMSEQIRRWAARVRTRTVDDMDGGSEEPRATRSVFRGPEPRAYRCESREKEAVAALNVVREWRTAGFELSDIGIFSRTAARSRHLREALDGAGIRWISLATDQLERDGAIQIGTMHRAKGLEFKVVLVLGCGEDDLPDHHVLQEQDPWERDLAMERERNLLYAAMTRARDELVMTWVGSRCSFLRAQPSAGHGREPGNYG